MVSQYPLIAAYRSFSIDFSATPTHRSLAWGSSARFRPSAQRMYAFVYAAFSASLCAEAVTLQACSIWSRFWCLAATARWHLDLELRTNELASRGHKVVDLNHHLEYRQDRSELPDGRPRWSASSVFGWSPPDDRRRLLPEKRQSKSRLHRCSSTARGLTPDFGRRTPASTPQDALVALSPRVCQVILTAWV